MKVLLTVCFLITTVLCFAQKELKEVKPTQSFTISGEVKVPATITLADLKKWKETSIGDVVITNHLGEKNSDAKSLKGVLLKDVLQSVEYNAENPKVLSEFYFVCKATDNYTVVYSWNEIYNTATGESAYIITEKEGVAAADRKDAIQMISCKDFKTGRRSLYALTSIEVKRAR